MDKYGLTEWLTAYFVSVCFPSLWDSSLPDFVWSNYIRHTWQGRKVLYWCGWEIGWRHPNLGSTHDQMVFMSAMLCLDISTIPAPESESVVCLPHAEVALDSWQTQSVHRSVSDLHAQQTLSVHHSGLALNMLTSRKKEASPLKALPVTYTPAFRKTPLTKKWPPNPTVFFVIQSYVCSGKTN